MNRWSTPGYRDPVEERGLRIIAAAVRAKRLGSGISQSQLAYWTGLNQSTISRLESGRLRTMRMVTLARVIGVLNMDPHALAPGGPAAPTRRLPRQAARPRTEEAA